MKKEEPDGSLHPVRIVEFGLERLPSVQDETMAKPRAFTLIELLVVIAIIALLMAILMPTLQRVNKQAKAIACQSILHQWAVIFEMYAGQNDGFFWSGDYSRDGWEQYCWTEPLRPFYNNDEKVRLCPMATVGRWISIN